MTRLIALAALIVAIIWGVASVADAGTAGTAHYPDLVTEAPAGVKIVSDKTSGKKLLRFSNAISNKGNGPFELRAENDTGTGTTQAFQRVLTHDPPATSWWLHHESHVGTFVFHPAHNHWHFDGFALYELRTVAPGGGIGRRVAASSPKVSFCMVDTIRPYSELEHSPATRRYNSCLLDYEPPILNVQGISVGWADVYAASLPGQSIDITHVQSGTYWLVSTADPGDLIEETNETNNSAAVQVTIRSSWQPKQ